MAELSTKTVRTACPGHCAGSFCGLLAHVEDDKLVKLEPGPFPDPAFDRICLRGLASRRLLYHSDRILHPLRRTGERGSGQFEQISWDDALDSVAAGFRQTADKYGPAAVGMVLGGPGGGTTKFGVYLRLAALMGASRVSTYGYGDAAGPAASYATFGTRSPQAFVSGLEDPDLIICWGHNPGEAEPFNMREIYAAKERGAKIVVIDPRFTVTASKADQYVPVRPGTDAALALAMMDVIIKRGLHDEAFIRRHTVGPFLVRADNGHFLREREVVAGGGDGCVVWDESTASPRGSASGTLTASLHGSYEVGGVVCRPAFALLAELAATYPISRAAETTNVSADVIQRLALAYARAKPASVWLHMGLTRTYYGDISARAVCTLAAITGQISLPGSPAHRQYVLNWDAFLKPGPPGYRRIGVLSMYDAITKGQPYPIKACYFAFINFINQCANSDRIRRDLMGNLDFIAVADMFMTISAQYADVVLPVCSSFEFSDLIIGPPPYMQLQQKIVPPRGEAHSDVWIASELGRRLGFAKYFDKDEEGMIDLLLASGDPSVAGISVKSLREGPQLVTGRNEPPQDVTFRTPSGKIEFYVERLLPHGQALPVYIEPLESARQPLAKRYPLVYVQGHSRFRTHSMFGNVDWLLDLNPEPTVDINPKDAAARGIGDGDMVDVFNDRGQARLKALVNEGIQPGVINITEGWWPNLFAKGGVNVLTSEALNPAQALTFEPNMPLNDCLVEVRKVEEEQ